MRKRYLVTLTLGLAALLGGVAGPGAAQASAYPTMVGVVPGKASCAVTWWRPYFGTPITTYKVWVVPQEIAPKASPIYRKIVVTPQKPGAVKSITVGALTKGAGYVFWLEADFPSYVHAGQVSLQQGASRPCVPL